MGKSLLERDCLNQQAFPGEEGGNFRGAFQEISELAHKNLSFKILCCD